MPSTVFYVIASLVAWQISSTVSGLWRNIAKAKATGLPYHIVRKSQQNTHLLHMPETDALLAMSPINQLAQLVAPLIIALWKMLPRKYWEDILPYV